MLPIDSRAGSMKPGFSLNTLGSTKKVDLGVEGSLAGELCLNSHPRLIQGIVLALLCSYCSSWGDNNSPSWEQPRSQGHPAHLDPSFCASSAPSGGFIPFIPFQIMDIPLNTSEILVHVSTGCWPLCPELMDKYGAESFSSTVRLVQFHIHCSTSGFLQLLEFQSHPALCGYGILPSLVKKLSQGWRAPRPEQPEVRIE